MARRKLSEAEIAEAIELERVLTIYQGMLLISLETGKMQHTNLAEPDGVPSQMLALERAGLIAAMDTPGESFELRLTSKGEAMAVWFRAVLGETIGAK